MTTIKPSPQRLASYARRRDQCINTIMTMLTLHADALRPLERYHIDTLIHLLREDLTEPVAL
jgi:hypothetical protein